jgi:UDP-2,4-diacetamido-2,4,6-trideoxy-beta-L-altropyranose hydrolase
VIAAFRSDASSGIGSGHIMRCLTLAETLAERGWRCVFGCGVDTAATVPLLAASNFEIVSPDGLQAIRPDLLIVDHYGLDSSYEKAARVWAGKTAVLDDLADRPHDCDLLFDQTYGRSEEDYKELVPANCRILTGADYMLLRPQFAQARALAEKRRAEKSSGQVLIAIGSTNYKNIVSKILSGFRVHDTHAFAINVVLSSGAEKLDDVERIVNETNAAGIHTVGLHLDVKDMAALMVEADIAVGAGGTTTWERCCLGLPTLMIELADNQIPTIAALTKAGAIVSVGKGDDEQAIETIPARIADMLSDPEKMQALSRASFQICDGMGLARSVYALEELCHKSL